MDWWWWKFNNSFTVSDQSGSGSVDVKGGMTQMGAAGATYRGYYGGGHEGSGGSANGRLRIEDAGLYNNMAVIRFGNQYFLRDF